METMPYGNESTYIDCILRLYNTSSTFLDSMKKKEIKFLSDPIKGKLPDMVTQIGQADLGYVSNLQQHISTLDTEFSNLVKKFQIYKKEYSSDSKMTKFLGDYNQNPAGSFKQLAKFLEESKKQNESVITSYSNISKDTNRARHWIRSIMASEQTTDKVRKKARNSSKTIQELDILIDSIRTICQDANFELVQIKSTVNSFISPKKDTV